MIVIPARDEGPRIGAVLERLRAVMPAVPVLVVANGCADDTVAQAAQRDATVLSAPEGYASALAVGYAHALDLWGGAPPEGSWLVQLDADGQHPPEALPALVAGLSRAHVVIGSRWAGGRGPTWMEPGRRLGIGVLAWWARQRAGLGVRDVTSGLQACRGEVVPWLARELRRGRVDADLLVSLDRAGFVLDEVAVEMCPREGGRSQHAGLAAVRYSLEVLLHIHQESGQPASRRRPLHPWQDSHG